MAATMTTVVKGNEEAGNFFSRMAWYYQMGVLLLLAALLFLAGDYMLYSDTRAKTNKMVSETQKLKASNAQGNIIKQNLKQAEETLAEKQREMDYLRQLLPDEVEISAIYQTIKDLMIKHNLGLNQFLYDKQAPSDYYTEQPIKVSLTGQYNNLGQFFAELDSFTRIISVTDVEIKTANDDNQREGRSLECSFKLRAYFLSQDNLQKLTAKPTPAPAANAANQKPNAQPNQKK
ncbi:MAG TPA: type 4a pilus biogenesis protein PilO [Blastocatellia bacterium]|nr:type 4a pilus biogenesis protein PilO [Blastocatellia bacterium]